eukprot:6467478-Amphidinium_carterae.1
MMIGKFHSPARTFQKDTLRREARDQARPAEDHSGSSRICASAKTDKQEARVPVISTALRRSEHGRTDESDHR